MKWQTRLKHKLHARRYFLAVIILIVTVRELSVIVTSHILGDARLGNFLGLFVLLLILIIYHRFNRIPKAIYQSANQLLKHNTFAILPVMGGCYFTLQTMGNTRYPFLLICLLSVAVSIWLYAHLAKRYLS